MSQAIEVKVPDIGDYKDVPVIEVLVKAGDTVEPEQSLVTLESDKATMDVPSPSGGTVKEVKVKVGDSVSEGTLIILLEGGAAAQPNGAAAPAEITLAHDLEREGRRRLGDLALAHLAGDFDRQWRGASQRPAPQVDHQSVAAHD